jgi:hypothetical protein
MVEPEPPAAPALPVLPADPVLPAPLLLEPVPAVDPVLPVVPLVLPPWELAAAVPADVPFMLPPDCRQPCTVICCPDCAELVEVLEVPCCWAKADMLAATTNVVAHWNVRFMALSSVSPTVLSSAPAAVADASSGVAVHGEPVPAFMPVDKARSGPRTTGVGATQRAKKRRKRCSSRLHLSPYDTDGRGQHE